MNERWLMQYKSIHLKFYVGGGGLPLPQRLIWYFIQIPCANILWRQRVASYFGEDLGGRYHGCSGLLVFRSGVRRDTLAPHSLHSMLHSALCNAPLWASGLITSRHVPLAPLLVYISIFIEASPVLHYVSYMCNIGSKNSRVYSSRSKLQTEFLLAQQRYSRHLCLQLLSQALTRILTIRITIRVIS